MNAGRLLSQAFSNSLYFNAKYWYHAKDRVKANIAIFSLPEEKIFCNKVAPSDGNVAASWPFFLHSPRSLADRQSDNNNIAISFSSSFVLSDRSFPLPRDIAIPSFFVCCRIAGHSIYISVLSPLFADKRVSMATISSARRTNRVSALLHLSFASSFSFSPFFLFPLPFSPFKLSVVTVCDLSSSHTRYRRLVRRSVAIMTSRGGEYVLH